MLGVLPKKVGFVLIVLLFGVFPVSSEKSMLMASEEIQWYKWSAQAFDKAAKENKLVLLDISAKWCQFCKKMQAVTYKDPEVIGIINTHYIAIHADIDISREVQLRYSNLGVPGTVILNSSREELNKRLGYIQPLYMQWHLLGILQDTAKRRPSAMDKKHG